MATSYDEFGKEIQTPETVTPAENTPVNTAEDAQFETDWAAQQAGTLTPKEQQSAGDDAAFAEIDAAYANTTSNSGDGTASFLDKAGSAIGGAAKSLFNNLFGSSGSGGGAKGPQQSASYTKSPDWRFKINLAPKARYLYNSASPGILAPLKTTDGVIFPYQPSVTVNYTARYDTAKLTHSNYDFHSYQGSSVESISVTADFTAQDVAEANYMLAVIHFFRSSTKMFYGQDANAGVPPPLLYLSGGGQYNFDNHPMVLTSFTYAMPTDVDYINAYPNGVSQGINGSVLSGIENIGKSAASGLIRGALDKLPPVAGRLLGSNLNKFGLPQPASFTTQSTAQAEVTRVPTKISLNMTFLPVITRYAAANKFSLEQYASGSLLRGSKNQGTGGGMW